MEESEEESEKERGRVCERERFLKELKIEGFVRIREWE